MSNIFKKIGRFFKSLFTAAQTAYDKLSDAEKDALKEGTGLVAIINDHLDDTPQAVLDAIIEKFPNIDQNKLVEGIFKVAQALNITNYTTIHECIAAIQEYLRTKDGKDWAVASHTIALILTVVFAPPVTKVAALVALIEFVYQKFIKQSL